MTAPTGGDARSLPGETRSARRPAVSVWNVANAVTMLRLALVPLFGTLLLLRGGDDSGLRVGAAAVFGLAALTDLLDGEIARRWSVVTDLGKVADPIADKALMGTALVGLSILGELHWAVTVVVLAREAGVTALRLWVLRHGVIAASRGGKAKTLLQGIGLALYILPLDGALQVVAEVVLGAAVVVTVVTGADYVRRALRLRRDGARGADNAA